MIEMFAWIKTSLAIAVRNVSCVSRSMTLTSSSIVVVPIEPFGRRVRVRPVVEGRAGGEGVVVVVVVEVVVEVVVVVSVLVVVEDEVDEVVVVVVVEFVTTSSGEDEETVGDDDDDDDEEVSSGGIGSGIDVGEETTVGVVVSFSFVVVVAVGGESGGEVGLEVVKIDGGTGVQ